MRIKKGDTVKILKGKDRGKTGKVLHAYPEERKIMIEGLNLYKKHVRPRREGEKGQVVEVPRAVPEANVGILCPRCNRAVRVGYRLEQDKKVRACRRCKGVL